MKGVRFASAGTAWRHPFGRQASYQCDMVFDSRKTLFFVLFLEQEPPGGSFMPPGATDFSGLRSFRKTAFTASLTVRFG